MMPLTCSCSSSSPRHRLTRAPPSSCRGTSLLASQQAAADAYATAWLRPPGTGETQGYLPHLGRPSVEARRLPSCIRQRQRRILARWQSAAGPRASAPACVDSRSGPDQLVLLGRTQSCRRKQLSRIRHHRLHPQSAVRTLDL